MSFDQDPNAQTTPKHYCPNCSCVGCKIANFKEEYDRLLQRAKMFGGLHPQSEEDTIVGCLGGCRQIPCSIGYEAVMLIDKFRHFISSYREEK